MGVTSACWLEDEGTSIGVLLRKARVSPALPAVTDAAHGEDFLLPARGCR